jgi:ABC-type lipoprotein export system ATPase subunit
MLLADEVTAGLDRANVDLVTHALRRLVDDGAMVVAATHDQRVWERADCVVDLAAAT